MHKHDIDVDINVKYTGGNVEASGVVTMDGYICFPVQLKHYINKETGEKDSFISFPRRERDGQWEDAVSMDKDLKEDVKVAVWEAIMDKTCRTSLFLPDIEVVSLNPVNYSYPSDTKVCVCGYATVRTCGVTIHGISIKKGEKGMFINVPQYKNGKGEYKDLVYPTAERLKNEISKVVIERYQKIQKGIQNGSLEPQTQKERSISI